MLGTWGPRSNEQWSTVWERSVRPRKEVSMSQLGVVACHYQTRSSHWPSD